MMCLVKLRSDFPEEEFEWDGCVYNHWAWFLVNENPIRLPKSIFRIKIRSVSAGDPCPTCKTGTVENAFDEDPDDEFQFFWCESCGGLDEDEWWEDLKLKIRWGSIQK